jgi:hypothetical protein
VILWSNFRFSLHLRYAIKVILIFVPVFSYKKIKRKEMYKIMKIRDLKNYGIPSCVLDIWKENYSPCLLPLQEEAVRNYGILSCGGNEEGRLQYAPTEGIDSHFRGNDRGEGSDEIAAPSSKARNDERGSTGLPQ